MNIADGKEADGTTYRVDLKGKNWVVVVRSPDGRELTESFPCDYRPVCGPDVSEVQKAEVVMDRLIKKLSSS